MLTIHLHHLKFQAFHGLHEEEKIVGGTFEVNADIKMKESGSIKEITQTLDYSKVYEVIKEIMLHPEALLETLVQKLIDSISKLDSRIIEITLTVTKCNPPIAGFSGSVGVTLQKKVDA